MSEPTDPNPPDPAPSDSGDDKDLSSLYARGSNEQPSDALDQAILDKARKASARDSMRTHRFAGWPKAVSAAAVVVLSVLVVKVIDEGTPERTAEPVTIAGRSDVAQADKAAAMPSRARPAPPASPAERRKAEAPVAERPAMESEEAPRAFIDRLALNEAEKDQRPAGEGTLGKATAAAPAAAPVQEPIASGLARSDVKPGTDHGFPQSITSEEKHCAEMTERECLASAACTLTKNETGAEYQCRFAKDPCELMFRQSEGTRESCEAKTECVYVPASCYCPPDTACECSGGEPAQCQKR